MLNEGVTIGSHLRGDRSRSAVRRATGHACRAPGRRSSATGRSWRATLATSAAHQLEAALRHGSPDEGVIELDGGSQAYSRLATAGPASIYAISSIDEGSWREPCTRANRSLIAIGLGAIALALLGEQRVAGQDSGGADRAAVHVRWSRLPRLAT